MMFCLLGEKSHNHTESNSYREAVKCQEKSSSKDLVIMANLAWRNETNRSGFRDICQHLRFKVSCIMVA